jgi:hypothetical protein
MADMPFNLRSQPDVLLLQMRWILRICTCTHALHARRARKRTRGTCMHTRAAPHTNMSACTYIIYPYKYIIMHIHTQPHTCANTHETTRGCTHNETEQYCPNYRIALVRDTVKQWRILRELVRSCKTTSLVIYIAVAMERTP